MKIYNELESLGFFEWLSETHNLSDTDMKPKYLDELPLNDIHITVCNSMVFRWFREKYKYLVSPFSTESEEGKVIYYFEIGKVDKFTVDIYSDDKSTYEEAELACLIKLIEILTKNNNEIHKR
jgi:hypothetical protein